MAENSKIQWTHHTFNPWIGCTKIAPECAHCYAETLATRFGWDVWGKDAERRVKAESGWRDPIRWNREAEAAGERRRVFCASLADVFELRPVLEEPRRRLFDLIDSTPWLDWLMLTKRPENILPLWSGGRRENVWLGTSAGSQATANRAVPELLACHDLSPVLFLSAEPLIDRLDLTRIEDPETGATYDALRGGMTGGEPEDMGGPRLGWVIAGGESGPNARPCDVSWIRDLVRQCGQAGAVCFVKQLGAVPVFDYMESSGATRLWAEMAGCTMHRKLSNPPKFVYQVHLKDRKGGDPSEWPEDLRVRQMPDLLSKDQNTGR